MIVFIRLVVDTCCLLFVSSLLCSAKQWPYVVIWLLFFLWIVIVFLALYKEHFKTYSRLYSIIFWRHLCKRKCLFYFDLKVFSMLLDKFLLFNSKQFGNWFEKNINLSKLEETIPCGQVVWFCLVVLNLSFYRFEKKNITSIWSTKITKFL